MLRSLKGGGEWAVRIQAHSETLSHSAHLDNEGSIDLSFPLFLSSSALQLLAFQCLFIFIPLFCKNTSQCNWDSPCIRRECVPSVALFQIGLSDLCMLIAAGSHRPSFTVYLDQEICVLVLFSDIELRQSSQNLQEAIFFFVMLTIQDYMEYDYLNVNETILYIFHPTNSNHPRRAWQGLIAGNP